MPKFENLVCGSKVTRSYQDEFLWSEKFFHKKVWSISFLTYFRRIRWFLTSWDILGWISKTSFTFTFPKHFHITFLPANLREGSAFWGTDFDYCFFNYIDDFWAIRWVMRNIKITTESWDISLSDLKFWSALVYLWINTATILLPASGKSSTFT